MEKQIHNIIRVFGFIYMAVLAVTIIQGIWSYAVSGEASGSPEERVNKIVESLMKLPLLMVQMVFQLVGSIVEAAVKLILNLFGASSLAKSFKIEMPAPKM